MQRSDLEPSSTTTIPVAQALLILLDTYRNNEKVYGELKKLYLSGAKTPGDKASILMWMKDPALTPYQISYEARVISEDPTRRYFETHLAFWTLHASIKNLVVEDLEGYAGILFGLVPKRFHKEAMSVLKGKKVDFGDHYLLQEYNDALTKLKSGNYFSHFTEKERNFSRQEKQKLILLFTIMYLSVLNASCHSTRFPLNLYGSGFFTPENRGRVDKENIAQVKSHHLGLMKSYMPIPSSDIAYSSTPSTYPRPVDRHDFVEEASWCQDNFNYLVHPFSCSLSGTLLVQFRLLAVMSKAKVNTFLEPEKLANLIKSMTSLLLINSGGHSFHEFFSVLSLPPVSEFFGFIDGFDDFNEETLLLEGNEQAFDLALDAAIVYNRQLLKRSAVLAEVKERFYGDYGNDSLFFARANEGEKELEKEENKAYSL